MSHVVLQRAPLSPVEVPHPTSAWAPPASFAGAQADPRLLGFVRVLALQWWATLKSKSIILGSPKPPRGLFPGCLSQQPQGDTVGIGWERVPRS